MAYPLPHPAFDRRVGFRTITPVCRGGAELSFINRHLMGEGHGTTSDKRESLWRYGMVKVKSECMNVYLRARSYCLMRVQGEAERDRGLWVVRSASWLESRLEHHDHINV